MTNRFNYVLLCSLVSACADTVKISYPPESVIHPTFDKPYTVWMGERVKIDWTPSLRAESFKYLATYNRVLLADSIRQRDYHWRRDGGLRNRKLRPLRKWSFIVPMNIFNFRVEIQIAHQCAVVECCAVWGCATSTNQRAEIGRLRGFAL